jgi:hypothetical protein
MRAGFCVLDRPFAGRWRGVSETRINARDEKIWIWKEKEK